MKRKEQTPKLTAFRKRQADASLKDLLTGTTEQPHRTARTPPTDDQAPASLTGERTAFRKQQAHASLSGQPTALRKQQADVSLKDLLTGTTEQPHTRAKNATAPSPETSSP